MFSRILKKNLFPPLIHRLLWLLPAAVLGSLFFLGAYLATGADLQARQSVHRFYEGNAVVYQNSYVSNSPNNLQTWWMRQDLGVQQLDSQEFVRGYSRRTKFPAFIIKDKERIPVELTIIEDGDERAFPVPIRPDGYFPDNAVTMGIGLSAKHAIPERSLISVIIPALEVTLTNQIVEKVYNLKEVYLQNYAVYIHRRTLNNALGNAMRSYHLSFTATPFTRLLLSNIQPLVPNSRFEAGSDTISYALNLLEELKKLLFEGYLVVNFLAGILYAYILYRSTVRKQRDCSLYYKRNGFTEGSLFLPLALDFLQAALFTAIFAALFSLIFENLPFEFLVFAPYTGLYPEFALKVSQGIVPLTDYGFLLKSLPLGMFFFVLSASGAQVLLKFFEAKNKEMGSLLTLITVSVLLSFMIARPLILLSYAQSARDNVLKEHYFGDYSLKHKFADQALSFNAGPEAFALDRNAVGALAEQGFQGLARLEAFGEVIQNIKINEDLTTTNRRSVRFIGLRGKAPAGYESLLQAIESNQVIIGRAVGEAFPNIDVLPLSIYGQSSNISVTLPISATRDFDIPFYNNCIFINIDTLAAYVGAPESAATSFLSHGGGSQTFLRGIPNPNLEISPFKKQKLLWAALEQPAFFIRKIIFLMGMGSLVLLAVACLTASAARGKERLVYRMIWGIPTAVTASYYTVAASMLAGTLFSALSAVPNLLISSPMPSVLNLSPYTPSLLPFQISWSVLFFILVGLILLLVLGYMSLAALQSAYYKRLIHAPSLPDSGEDSNP